MSFTGAISVKEPRGDKCKSRAKSASCIQLKEKDKEREIYRGRKRERGRELCVDKQTAVKCAHKKQLLYVLCIYRLYSTINPAQRSRKWEIQCVLAKAQQTQSQKGKIRKEKWNNCKYSI